MAVSAPVFAVVIHEGGEFDFTGTVIRDYVAETTYNVNFAGWTAADR